jgi:hypothetical protein
MFVDFMMIHTTIDLILDAPTLCQPEIRSPCRSQITIG